jgi:hypothetical protein
VVHQGIVSVSATTVIANVVGCRRTGADVGCEGWYG